MGRKRKTLLRFEDLGADQRTRDTEAQKAAEAEAERAKPYIDTRDAVFRAASCPEGNMAALDPSADKQPLLEVWARSIVEAACAWKKCPGMACTKNNWLFRTEPGIRAGDRIFRFAAGGASEAEVQQALEALRTSLGKRGLIGVKEYLGFLSKGLDGKTWTSKQWDRFKPGSERLGSKPSSSSVRAKRRAHRVELPEPTHSAIEAAIQRVSAMDSDATLRVEDVKELMGLSDVSVEDFTKSTRYVARRGHPVLAHQLPPSNRPALRNERGNFSSGASWIQPVVLKALKGQRSRQSDGAHGPF